MYGIELGPFAPGTRASASFQILPYAMQWKGLGCYGLNLGVWSLVMFVKSG